MYVIYTNWSIEKLAPVFVTEAENVDAAVLTKIRVQILVGFCYAAVVSFVG